MKNKIFVSINMIKKFIKILLFLPTVAVIIFSIMVKDNFYLIPAIILFFIGILFAFPSFFSSKKGRVNSEKRETIIVKKIHPRDIKERIIIFIKNFLQKKYLMLFLFGVLLFGYLSIFKAIIPEKETNAFFSFYVSQFNLLMIHWLATIISVAALATVFFVYLRKKGNISERASLRVLGRIAIVVFISFNVAFLTTYPYAIGEITYFYLKINKNPKSLNIVWKDTDIVDNLRNIKDFPKIIRAGDNLSKQLLSELLVDRFGENRTFYSKEIMPSVVNFFIPSLNIPKDVAIITVNNKIIIREFNKDIIEKVSPALGKLMVETYFSSRNIKDEPNVSLVGRQEYLKLREEQINKQVAEIDKDIDKAQGLINYTYGLIQGDKTKIGQNQSGLNQGIASRNSAYSICINEGYWKSVNVWCPGGCIFPPTQSRWVSLYSSAECESMTNNKWDNIINTYKQNIANWQAQLQSDQKELKEYQDLKKTIETYRSMAEAQKESTPQELGIFEADNNIKIALDSIEEKAFIDYLATLSHEYLHYTSYVSKERSLPSFFEEGLTEYFSRKIIKKDLDSDTNLGYPLFVKIISEIAKKIPEDQLADVYFTKDDGTLKALLDNAFGEDFYKDSEIYFKILAYVSPEDALKYANNLVVRMGGSEITEEEMYSSLSEFK